MEKTKKNVHEKSLNIKELYLENGMKTRLNLLRTTAVFQHLGVPAFVSYHLICVEKNFANFLHIMVVE